MIAEVAPHSVVKAFDPLNYVGRKLVSQIFGKFASSVRSIYRGERRNVLLCAAICDSVSAIKPTLGMRYDIKLFASGGLDDVLDTFA
jgi:hypothetical protein